MYILYQICFIVFNIKLYLSQDYVLPLAASSSPIIFARKINTTAVYVGNTVNDTIYNYETNNFVHLRYPSKCAKGSVCPLLLLDDSNNPKYLVSKVDSHDLSQYTKAYVNDLRDLSNVEQREVVQFGYDVTGVIELDQNNTIIFTRTSGDGTFEVAERGGIIVNISNGSFNYTTKTVSPTYEWNAIKIDASTVLHFSHYSYFYYGITGWDCQISSSGWNDIETPFNFTSSNYYYQLAKISNYIILCYLDSNVKVICISFNYNSGMTLNSYKTMISDCSYNSNYDSFSLYTVDSNAVVSCGYNPLKIQVFSPTLTTTETLKTISSKYIHYIDFIPLSSSIYYVFGSLNYTSSLFKYVGERIVTRSCNAESPPTYNTFTEYDVSTLFSSPTEISNNVPYFIKFLSISNMDSFSLYSKNASTIIPIQLNELTLYNNIYLYSEVPLNVSFSYSKKQFLFGQEQSDFSIYGCVVQISITSASCSGANCNSCDDGYFPKETTSSDTSFDCYNETTKPHNYFFNSESQIYQQCYHSCYSCNSKGDDTNHNCIENSCNEGYYPGIDNNCYDNTHTQEGYVLYDSHFVQCLPQCKTCDYPDLNDGEHHCTECADGYMKNVLKNGFCEKCLAGYKFYYDKDGNYQCTESCTDEYPILITEHSQCVYSCGDLNTCEYCINNAPLYEYNNECVVECPEDLVGQDNRCVNLSNIETTNNNTNTNTGVSTGMEAKIEGNVVIYELGYDQANGSFNEKITNAMGVGFDSLNEHPNSLTRIEDDECSFEFYSTSTEKDSLKGSGSPRIDLGECEDILRSTYQIPQDEPLIIFQIVYNNESSSSSSATNQMQYEVYTQNQTKLNLEPCKDVQIKITKPLTNIDNLNLNLSRTLSEQGIDIYDAESPIFNDRCTTLSIDGKDVSMSDRRDKVFTNVTFCENGCQPKEIDYEYNEVECECETVVEGFDSTMEDMDMFSEFTDFISNSNFALFLCVNSYSHFGKEGLTNTGNILTLPCAFTVTVLGAVVLKCQMNAVYSLLNKYISNPVRLQKQSKTNNNKEQMNMNNDNDNGDRTKRSSNSQHILKQQTNIIIKSTAPFKNVNSTNNNLQSSKSIELSDKDSNLSDKIQNISEKCIPKRLQLWSNEFKQLNDDESSLPSVSLYKHPNSTKDKERNILSHQDLNSLEFKDAEKQDKRSFCRFYWDIFSEKQIILSTITTKDSIFTPLSFRLTILIFTLMSFLFLNALLFTEDYITNRYNSTDSLGIVYMLKNELSKSVYSSLIGMVIAKVVSMSTESAENIRELMQHRNEPYFEEDLKYEISSMKLKYKLLISIMIIISWVYWYFIYIFCFVYKNNQISWLEATLFSIALNIVIPAVVCFIAAILRISALKCHISLIYNLSNCLYQFI